MSVAASTAGRLGEPLTLLSTYLTAERNGTVASAAKATGRRGVPGVPSGSDVTMNRTWWRWARLWGGAAILAVLVWRVGTGPFLDGIRTIDVWSLAAAVGIAGLTTVCCAWRWRLVARGLGVAVPMGPGVAAYYRSQFLNTTLPGGVLGDVHRGVRHGRDVGDVGRGLRAVGWERSSGQLVQIVLTVILLLVLPSPVRSSVPLIAAAIVAGGLIILLLGWLLPHSGPSRWAKAMRTAVADVRHGLLARRAWPGIVLASTVVVVGHATTFLIAARTAGVTAPLTQLLPLALLVLAAMGLPTNIGGWGPREGVAAWAFAAAGLSATQGVATAVVYGVMVLVASLPGAIVLLVAWRKQRSQTSPSSRRPAPAAQPSRPLAAQPSRPLAAQPSRPLAAAIAGPEGAARG